MNDEESQTVAVPAPKAIEEENTTTISTDGNPDDIQQPHVNFLLRVIQRQESRLQEWFERSYPETATRKASDYTSRSFLCLPTPMPVHDILLDQNVWWIIILRSIEEGLNYLIFATIAYQLVFGFLPVIAIYLLLRLAWPALPGFSMALNIVPKIWEWGFARIMLKPDRKKLTKFWWFIYLLISSHCNFEANYMRAWAENAVDSKKTTIIFVGDEELSIPWLEGDELDKPRLEHLRMFYLLLKLRRGLLEIIVPKTLLRIDWVKIEDASHVLGERVQTVDLGRRTGTLVARFHNPKLVEEGSKKLAEVESKLKESISEDSKNVGVSVGIEFVRRYDTGAIIGIVSTPPLLSVIFAAVWMSWFLTREKDDKYDPQVIVTTALTGALYLVTAGALGIALVAYLDTKVDDSLPKSKEGG